MGTRTVRGGFRKGRSHEKAAGVPIFLCVTAAFFVAVFLAFETLHPVGDLLGTQKPRAATAHGHQGEGEPLSEAHGPYLSSVNPSSRPPSARRLRPLRSIELPEAPFLEPSIPVPIVPAQQA